MMTMERWGWRREGDEGEMMRMDRAWWEKEKRTEGWEE